MVMMVMMVMSGWVGELPLIRREKVGADLALRPVLLSSNTWRKQFHNLDKYNLQFRQIHFTIWTNSFWLTLHCIEFLFHTIYFKENNQKPMINLKWELGLDGYLRPVVSESGSLRLRPLKSTNNISSLHFAQPSNVDSKDEIPARIPFD